MLIKDELKKNDEVVEETADAKPRPGLAERAKIKPASAAPSRAGIIPTKGSKPVIIAPSHKLI